MARILPSFHPFHLFRPQRHNTNFLLTSKNEPKHPGVSFPSNPNLLMGYFIYSSIWATIFLPQEQFKTKSTTFLVHTTRYPRFCTYTSFSNLPSRFKINLFKNKSQTPFQGNLHNSVWPLTSQYFNKISNPFLGEFHSHYHKFLNPSLEGDLHKIWYASTSTQDIDPILGRLLRTLSISTTFPNIEPIPQP